jgi:ADP-ribose pyrophosphatase YjhB (NUDIX family)
MGGVFLWRKGSDMDVVLRILYIVARFGRDVYWAITKPKLTGVRVIILDANDAILLVRHRAGPYAWTLPGGGVIPREPVIEAGRRELHEEAGVNIPAKLFYIHGTSDGAHEIHPCIVTTVAARAPKLTIPQPSRWSIEVADARFVHPSVFHELDDAIEPGCLRRIDEILTGKSVAAHW